MESQVPPENLKDRVKASYDAIAPTYNTWTKNHDSLRFSYLDELLSRVPKLGPDAPGSPAVLELGCGSGSPFLTGLLDRGCPGLSVVANDLSDTQLNLARENLAPYGPNRVRLVPGDMTTALDFAPGSLTAVVALYSLVHLPLDEQDVMLRRIAGWLEPGGVMIANFAVKELPGSVAETWLEEDKGWMYWSGFGREKTVQKLRDVGLTVEKEEVEGNDEQLLWVIARR